MTSSSGGEEGDDVKAGVGVADTHVPMKESSFAESDRVLAYHGPMLYDAKVVNAERRRGDWYYFGWSKSWDEWVPVDRLLKYNDANVAKMKKLAKQAKEEKRKAKARRVEEEEEEAEGERPGKRRKNEPEELPAIERVSIRRKKIRRIDNTIDDRDDDPVLKIQLPRSLKKQLVEDWSAISKDGKLVKLPRTPNVKDILRKYLDSKNRREKGGDALEEVVSGLRSYFDRALKALLLYRQEKAQYLQVMPHGTDQQPCDVYGGEHLLRLFVKLPELLAYTAMEEEALNRLQMRLADFLKFLKNHKAELFPGTYHAKRDNIGTSHS
eukprot:jgi/Chlat1/1426/Chrsp12S02059